MSDIISNIEIVVILMLISHILGLVMGIRLVQPSETKPRDRQLK